MRAEVDRLAAQLGTWDAHVHAYETALAATNDPSTKTSLLATMALIAAGTLAGASLLPRERA